MLVLCSQSASSLAFLRRCILWPLTALEGHGLYSDPLNMWLGRQQGPWWGGLCGVVGCHRELRRSCLAVQGFEASQGQLPASPAKLQCVTGFLVGAKALDVSHMAHCQG